MNGFEKRIKLNNAKLNNRPNEIHECEKGNMLHYTIHECLK